MNFYKRHVGDYLRDTAHLSLLEHGIYTRLLDVYYTRECAIPEDQAARLIGARSKDEREAVERVLEEFFTLQSHGWVQSRCEREIEAHQTQESALADLRGRDEYRQFRAAVLERDGNVCVYCGSTSSNLQIDHVIPKSRGGADTPENLAACCKPCNTSKGARTPEEWRASQ